VCIKIAYTKTRRYIINNKTTLKPREKNITITANTSIKDNILNFKITGVFASL